MVASVSVPLEIISLIADHVDVADAHPWTLVSKQFYARMNPLLWRQPSLRTQHALLLVVNTLRGSPHLASLVRIVDLVGFTPSHRDVSALLNLIPCLEELLVQHGQLLDMTTLTPHCPHLTFISFENAYVFDRIIDALARDCRHLRQLHLLHCSGLSCQVFVKLASLPLEELELDVSWPNMFPYRSIDAAFADVRALDLALLHRLTQLTLHRPPRLLVRSIVTTTTDRAGNLTWPRLQHLYLENCEDLDDLALIGFLESHRLLKSLVLVQGKFTDVALDAIAYCLSDGLTCLALVNCTKITHKGIRRLVMACPLLESVQLLGCHLLACHFPEADDHCKNAAVLNLYINYLDWDAISQIQQNPYSELGPMDDQDDDADDEFVDLGNEIDDFMDSIQQDDDDDDDYDDYDDD